MLNKVLFCATVDYHFKAFHLPILKWFKERGWEVHIAASGEIELPYVDEKYNIPIQRSPFHKMNIVAFQELKSIIQENDYKIIHCHTPMGGVLTRLAAKQARKNGTKVLYTAHGFHFCKGAPLMNWFLYYPIERVLSNYTDCLITINEEDYNLANSHRFKSGKVEHVHGVGVDTEQFKPISQMEKNELKKKLGFKQEDFLLFYAAEFNENKNQQFLIRVIAEIKDSLPNAKLLLAGEGVLLDFCKKLASELGVDKMVDFLGYRNDIVNLLPICDVAVASSLREGLPVNIMEAMACGLPVIATANRGHNELIQNLYNGWTIKQGNSQDMASKIIHLAKNLQLIKTLGENGRECIEKAYNIKAVVTELSLLYEKNMKEMEGLRWRAQ